MKILVTGGCGFIGATLIRYIFKETPFEVCNVDKLTYASSQEALSAVADSKKYRFFKADICNDSEMVEIFQQTQVDAIIHFAAETHVDRSIDAPDLFIDTNIIGTYSLLKAAKKYWGTLSGEKRKRFRFHHISTDEVFGDINDTSPPSKEGDPYLPNSPYSASKAASDHLVRAWHSTYNLPILITNCTNNFGPFQFPEKLIPHIIIKALKGEPLPVYGNGQQVRDWLYVEDHAEALMRVLEDGRLGETYNIGSRSPKKNIEVVEMICNYLDEVAGAQRRKDLKSYKDLITFVDDRPGHDRRYTLDPTKVETELGWLPRYGFEQGLKSTIDWYLANEPWWQNILSKKYNLERLGRALEP